ncbi:FAR1-related sequence 10, partial [Tanacetum coccineum]
EKGLRKLRKQAGNFTLKTSFYVGKEFPNRDVTKEMVRAHGVETRRNIMIVKNDKNKDKSEVFWCSSCDCQNDKTNDNDKGKEILDQGKKVERNTKEIAKGKKVNVHDKGKGKIVNEEEEDKSECPWVLYISKGDKGKWLVRTYREEHKYGFRASGRDLLGLDGAFMRGQYSGKLLTVVGVDANNGIYPVAYGLVESESTYLWTWFLTCLCDDLDLFTNSNFTFIIDRQKGLLPAIAKLFPAAGHRYCVRHIYENMNMTWKGSEYKEMLWNCATACTVVEFNRIDESSSPKAFDPIMVPVRGKRSIQRCFKSLCGSIHDNGEFHITF